jgi:uncharacterized protein (UPF0147 family)
MAGKRRKCEPRESRELRRATKPVAHPVELKRLLDVPPWEWPQDAADRFLLALTDKSVSVADRVVAAELAGDLEVMNDSLAIALLGITGSAEESEELRARAAIGLGAVLEDCDTTEFDDPLGYDDPPIAELTFHRIRATLQKLYADTDVPKLVRRRILEASVRSPQDWHRDAVREAYSSADRGWVLTAVFAMRWVRGFDVQILEALGTQDLDIHTEAVLAAGNWSVDAAWDHVAALVEDPMTPRNLRLAAIEALGSIRPKEAIEVLIDLADSPDEDIADAAEEALVMAEGASSFGDDEDEDEEGGF